MTDGTLVFQWRPDRFSLLFPAFLLLSLFLHLLGFYLFQVAYPGSGSVEPPPAQLVVLDRGNPAHVAMLNWIAAEDPARAARQDTVLPPGLLDLRYKPSYDRPATAPIVPPDPQPATKFPPAVDLSRLAMQAIVPSPPPRSARPAPLTRVVFSENLGRQADTSPPPAATTADLQPARFLIGVTPEGRTAFIFRRQSSGDDAADRLARQFIFSRKFAPQAGAAVTWGEATVYWGGAGAQAEGDE